MPSSTSVSNFGLQLLGAKRITDLTENSNNARSCSACFELIARAELEKGLWTFSLERATISADAATPSWGRAYSFTLPSDFIRRAPPYNEDVNPVDDYEIEGQKVYTNMSAPFYLRYVKWVEDVNFWSPLFCIAVGSRMASHMCEEITQSNTKKVAADQAYKDAIREALRTNALQKPPSDTPDSSWITDRI